MAFYIVISTKGIHESNIVTNLLTILLGSNHLLLKSDSPHIIDFCLILYRLCTLVHFVYLFVFRDDNNLKGILRVD